MTASLDLSPIGNCAATALIDQRGRYVWACCPRVDGEPVFSALLTPAAGEDAGLWSVDIEDEATIEQAYIRNTPILRTVMRDRHGNALEVIDFAPRMHHLNRTFRPWAFYRIIRPLSGAPRVKIRLTPTGNWGRDHATATSGSSHIRYDCGAETMRLTTNAPLTYVRNGRSFRLEGTLGFHLGPDEPYPNDVLADCEHMLRATTAYWQKWVRTLYLPLEWQEAVIRAAITLKLCAYEETGAIVAAMTTSIPEAPGSQRNWDYRYCWIRDAYYVVRALNRLGAADMLESYLVYLRNLTDMSAGGHVQPLYSVSMDAALTEWIAPDMHGYRGMGPVRVGNQAYEHFQHDVYGQMILPLTQSFFDQRFLRPGTIEDFHAMERVGERAFAMHDQPDAGLWEFRTKARVHTYSALLCWAACDRLGNAAAALDLPDRSVFWTDRARIIRHSIETRAWNEKGGYFAGSFEGEEVDASLLQLFELGFLPPDDPRCVATFAEVERQLRKGDNLYRYIEPDDFGEPETAFNFCTFWYIEALHLMGRTDEARDLFEAMLKRRTASGLLSEDVKVDTGELWGNFPQTYSLVGLITCAALLSRSWTAIR
ncbi:glycoside hydrolase family 15 protein [Asticcacaulis sp. 201]|uniref:glycoside hydrolase family 15 protein n=1 Tax=Asticcacaulis sp. 201 TaxID=3028787 RepID=UPI002916DF4B|nr:glycoside hydrolase family 15 protein [Asticcacaulis sp. 201]MDV6331251.1 glycoside hydrolase family 15 protein [Asticcacaulis sp. 201]